MNSRGAGRPVSRIELNLNNINKFKADLLNVCHNHHTKDKLLEALEDIRNELLDTPPDAPEVEDVFDLLQKMDVGDETHKVKWDFIYINLWDKVENKVEYLLEHVKNLSSDDQMKFHAEINAYMNKESNNKVEQLCSEISSLPDDDKRNIYTAIGNQFDDRVQHLSEQVHDLPMNDQVNFYGVLGGIFNEHIYQLSKETETKNIDMNDLIQSEKKEIYDKVDPRLKSFHIEMTKTRRDSRDKINDIVNAILCLFKARNGNSVNLAAIKHHLVAYIASNKSEYVSQILSHIGGHGNRNILEQILKNTEITCQFKDDKKYSLFLSYDNIQTIGKSYRLTSTERDKVFGVIVTSLLGVLPDGFQVCDVQFQGFNNPTWWFSMFDFDHESQTFFNKLDPEGLREMLLQNENTSPILLEYFWEDAAQELIQVVNDFKRHSTPNAMKDSVDIMIQREQNKRIKVCDNNHINQNCDPRQKKCKYPACKSKNLVEAHDTSYFTFDDIPDREIPTGISDRELYYMRVPAIVPENQPEQESLGAIPINPNSRERNMAVLDELKAKLDIQNKYCVELEIVGKDIKKRVIENTDIRSFVLLTTDGLPMKHIIDICSNTFICKECGKTLDHISQVKQHMDQTKGHKKFFLKYSVFLPNLGQFHETMAAYRALLKLLWDIDFKGLAAAIDLDSPKASFMIQKGVDYRKSLDFIRTARSAKLRELLTPFVIYCWENKVVETIGNFQRWIKETVHSENFLSTLQIEQIYGTGVLLFVSSCRANNYPMMQIAKFAVAPLFHIMNHPNYSRLELWSEYIDWKMTTKRPELATYINERRFANKTLKKYHAKALGKG